MAVFRNDFGEDRVVPTLGYHLVPDGGTVTVPDDEIEHWVAGGWAAADATTAKAVEAAAAAALNADAVPAEAVAVQLAAAPETPAVAPAKPTKDKATEGTEQ